MVTRWGLSVIVAALALGSCKSHESGEPRAGARGPTASQNQQSGQETANATGEADQTGPGPRHPEVDRSALREVARAVVDRWLESQNQRDFATYAGLYGEPFTGVRRSGTKQVEMKLSAWLADRKRMFTRPMKVELSDFAIRIDGGKAHARFVQRWASGGYEDVGPKRLVIDLEQKKIVGEEMLSSTITKNLSKVARALEMSKDEVESLSCEDLPDDSTRVVCVADRSEEELLAAYVVVLVKKGAQWEVLDKREGSATVTEMKYGPTNSAWVNSRLEEISKHKYAIAVTAHSESEGGWGPEVDDPGGHERKVEEKWFAIEGDRLREVLSIEGGGSSQLDYSGEFVEHSLAVNGDEASGYYTIAVESETSAWGDDTGHGVHDPKVDSSTSELHWDPDTRTYR